MADIDFDLTPITPQLGLRVEPATSIIVPIDPTLTIEGMAADAKAAGDAIRAITALTSSDIDDAMEDE